MQKGAVMVELREAIRLFMTACDSLLEDRLTPAMLTSNEKQMIQYYLSSLAAKYPALGS
jgi:hypothetical protein